jgi:IS605 OrfB family transposase
LKAEKTVPLVYVERWHGKYRGWRVGEARLLPGRLNVVVEKEIPAKPVNDVLGLDVNYANLTLSDGTKIPIKEFIKALAFKARAEAIQQKYPKEWRHIKGIRQAGSRFGARARNIIKNAVNQLAVQVVKLASQKNSALAIEDLKKLNSSFKDFSKNQRTRLTLWAYKKLLETLEFKAKIEGIPVIRVNPRGTSSKCPICQSKLKENGYRRLRCPSCGFKGDRDYVASLNVRMKALSGGLASDQM